VKDIEADNREDALDRMQGKLIQSEGSQRTCMTIGDVLVDEADAVYLVTAIGFSRLLRT
jgi:hypothetical protein